MSSELTELLIVAAAVVAAISLLRAMRRRRAGGGRKAFWTPRRRGNYRPWDQEAELLRLCHGDRDLAERLIAHELERAPDLSRAGAALAAATRLKHDKQ